MPARGRLTGVSSSPTRGVFKRPLAPARLIEGRGLEGDFHARGGSRQLSLLSQETLDALASHRPGGIAPGDLGENLTVAGLDLDALAPGTVLAVGATARVEITEPREPCRNLERVGRGLLKALVGRCGVLARVTAGGDVRPGDAVEVASSGGAATPSPPASRPGPLFPR